MCGRDRRNDYDVDGCVFDHFLAGPEGFDARVVLFSVVFGFRMALDDGVEIEG